jgi:muconate cycloisomerase
VKIAEIEIIPIRAPRKEAVRAGRGIEPVTASEFGIVRIVTDDGCEGFGEISITAPRIGFSLCHAARWLIAPRLIGLDPLRLPDVMRTVDSLLAGELSAPYLRAAFEMALLDLVGRHRGVPVWQLLGGRARAAVPLAWGIYQKDPAEMAADAAAAVAAGFQAIKLKIGRGLDEDLAAVTAVSRAVAGAVPLRLDANQAWRSVAEALHAIEALTAAGPVAWVEQPLGRRNLEGLRQLRQRSPAPIMVDESVQSLRDAYEAARAEAADLWNVYVVEAGGLLPASHVFALADSLDVPCIIGSQAELGIGTAAAAHLGVALPNLPYPCETFGPLRYERDVVAVGPGIADGFLTPPDGPGLGVELDWEIVNAWRVGE